ncbi:MAG TPA: hypothetical protein VEX38_06955 [Fimbriimonadaceae bacterium]|nr:hypothetical protein [Fimbriimonadaceae bacterium]
MERRHRILALVVAVAFCAGFRFHDYKVLELKPQMPSIGGPPGLGCGTGSTSTWTAHCSVKDLEMPVARAEALVRKDLLAQGYRASGRALGQAAFRRRLDGGGGISFFLRKDPIHERCQLICAIGVPKLSWYGLRVPAPAL